MTARFGAFGKMPSLGDFFRIDLPPGFVDPWDRWLQDSIATSRRNVGARWQHAYFTAPIWRFTLSPGLCGASAVCGVMMMSVDRVGRQFPLTFAAVLPDGVDPALGHLQASEVFVALESVALDALDDGMTREVLADRLGRVKLPAPAPLQAALRREPGGAVIHGTGDLMPQIAAEALRAIARRPSFWSADVGGETRMMVCEGLPDGGQLVGLFDLGARVWTGQDPVEEALSEPVAAAAFATSAPQVAHLAAAVAGPVDDPLADILLPDDAALPVTEGPDFDPLADILSASDPTFEDDIAQPAQGQA